MEERKTVLILYSKGVTEEHALALADFMKNKYRECDIVALDSDVYTGWKMSQIRRWWHEQTMRNMLFLHRAYFKLSEFNDPRRIAAQKKVSQKKFKELKDDDWSRFWRRMFGTFLRVRNALLRHDPEVVVCMTPRVLNRVVKEKYRLKKENMTVFSFNPEISLDRRFVNLSCDYFIVENQSCKNNIEGFGVESDRIFVVSPILKAETTKINEENLRAQMGIENELPVVTLSGGRIGAGSIKKVFDNLVGLKLPINLVVSTSGSETLVNFLNVVMKNAKPENVYMVESQSQAIDVGDIVICIPESVTMYEAFAKRKAVILTEPCDTVQKGNMSYAIAQEICDKIYDSNNLSQVLPELLENVQERERLAKAGYDYIQKGGAEQCAEILVKTAYAEKENADNDNAYRDVPIEK